MRWLPGSWVASGVLVPTPCSRDQRRSPGDPAPPGAWGRAARAGTCGRTGRRAAWPTRRTPRAAGRGSRLGSCAWSRACSRRDRRPRGTSARHDLPFTVCPSIITIVGSALRCTAAGSPAPAAAWPAPKCPCRASAATGSTRPASRGIVPAGSATGSRSGRPTGSHPRCRDAGSCPSRPEDGRVEQVLDQRPLLVRQLDHRAHVGSLPAPSVRLNGTDGVVRAQSIGYRCTRVADPITLG